MRGEGPAVAVVRGIDIVHQHCRGVLAHRRLKNPRIHAIAFQGQQSYPLVALGGTPNVVAGRGQICSSILTFLDRREDENPIGIPNGSLIELSIEVLRRVRQVDGFVEESNVYPRHQVALVRRPA